MVNRPFRRQRFLIHQRSSAETSPVIIAEFIAKWKKAELKERAAAQEHFLDLCHLAQLDAAVCAAYGWGGIPALETKRFCANCSR